VSFEEEEEEEEEVILSRNFSPLFYVVLCLQKRVFSSFA